MRECRSEIATFAVGVATECRILITPSVGVRTGGGYDGYGRFPSEMGDFALVCIAKEKKGTYVARSYQKKVT